jgi:hypothetical protein
LTNLPTGFPPDPQRPLHKRFLANRRFGIAAFAVLTVLLCSGSTAPTGCPTGNIGPSNAEVIGGAVAIGVGIAAAIAIPIAIHNSHHNLKGCVFSGPNGLELQTGDGKAYALEGDSAGVKVGDTFKVHGTRLKKAKGSNADQVFQVTQIKKDYGSCHLIPPPGTQQ